MQAIEFRVHLVQPVLAGQPGSGEANSTVSYPFIPGSMLRGALVSCYSGGKGGDLDNDETFFDLFFSGKVRYLNAYLANPNGRARMLPRPLSWFVPKKDIHNLSVPVYDFAVDQPGDDQTFKPPEGDFYWLGSDAIQLATPRVEMVVHNASADRDRKREGASQVYRYDALAAGQVFSAVVTSAEDDYLKKIKDLLETHDLVLGGSLTGGYGRVEVLTPIDIDPDWREGENFRQSEVERSQTEVTLTCLSDVIVRSAQGEYDFDLATQAGRPPSRVFRRMRLVGGYSRKWGLPFYQDWAIVAGSVFVFPAECRANLEAVVQQGIGERLIEGFGRCALDLHRQAKLTRSRMAVAPLGSITDAAQLSPASQEYAEKIAVRKLRNVLDTALAKRIHELAGASTSFSGLPRPAQLSRARLAARAAWQTGELGLIQKHFAGLSVLSRRTWKDARLVGKPLEEWLLQRVEKPALETFNVGNIEFAGVKAKFGDRLRAQTVARLLEGVLGRAVEAAKKNGGRG